MTQYKQTIIIVLVSLLLSTLLISPTIEHTIAISLGKEYCTKNQTQYEKISENKNQLSNPSTFIKLDQNQTQGDNKFQIFDNNWAAQSFTPSMDVLSTISIYVNLTKNEESISKTRINHFNDHLKIMLQRFYDSIHLRNDTLFREVFDLKTPSEKTKKIHTQEDQGNLTLLLRKELHGENLININKNLSFSLDEKYWIDWDLSDIIVEPNETYYIIITSERSDENYFYNWFYFNGSNNEDIYKNGKAFFSSNNGETWQDVDDGFDDFRFKTYGYISYQAPEEGDGQKEYWAFIASDGQGEHNLESYAKNLAYDIKNKLLSYGWDSDHITLLINDEVSSGFQNAVEWMDENDDGDDLCFYYGFGQNNESHVNSWIQSFDRLGSEGLGIIIDSGYNSGLIDKYAKSGRVILTSTNTNETAYYQPGYGFGIFSYYFLRSLDSFKDTNEDGWISLEESYEYVYTRVWMEGLIDQQPQIYDGYEGEFNIIKL